MDDYIAGIRGAWLGEQLGFAVFMARAEAEQDAALAAKWRSLAELEQVTGEHMASVLKAHGEMPGEAPLVDWENEAFQTYLSLPHRDVMNYMRGRVISALEDFESLLAAAPEADQESVRFLVDHELALLTFIDQEASGGEDSLAGVQELLDR